MNVRGERVLGRDVTTFGWICVLLIPLLLIDMLETLPTLPESWWQPPGQWEMRAMFIEYGISGWLGGVAFGLALLAWVPVAASRAWQGKRKGIAFRAQERILLTLVPTLIIAILLLWWLTPLRYT
jgi:hypothetical protein